MASTTLRTALLLFVPAIPSAEQIAPPAPPDPTALVRRAVQHRIDSAKTHHPLEYLIRRIDNRHDTTKLIIETSDGNVARLVAIGGKPLTPEADKAELKRLDNLASHPELQEHRRRNEQKDADRVTHLLSELPEAFLYTLEGSVPCASVQCFRLTFKPNPHFSPPDLESNILRGVAGELWIDQSLERLVRLDTRFISDVDFGFGIIGKISKGGDVLLEQTNIGDNDWELTNLRIHVSGKALLVRSFNYNVHEQTSHFAQVPPNLHYRDAISMLKSYDPSRTPYTP